MPTKKQNIINALSIFSLVLVVLTVGLWIKSYTSGDTIQTPTRNGASYYLVSVEGTIQFVEDYGSARWDSWKYAPYADTYRSRFEGWSFLGFGRGKRIYKWPGGSQLTGRNTGIPHLLPLLLIAILPGIKFFRWRRGKIRASHGECVRCGFCLTLSTTNACPECGNVFKPPMIQS